MRTHVVLPEDLVEEVDRIAGKRGRSRFIEDAVRRKLMLEKQRQALEDTVGSINLKDYPEWSTPEKTSAWVRKIRDEGERRLAEKWGREV